MRLRSPTGSRLQFGSLLIGTKKEMRTGGLNDAVVAKKGARKVVRQASVMAHQLQANVESRALQPLEA